MNKNLIFRLLVVVALVIAAGWAVHYLFNQPNNDTIDEQDNTEAITASYSDGETTVDASFNNEEDTVTFNHPSVGTVTLPRAISGSGARYANEDEDIVFWEHQGELTITVDDETTFKGDKEEASDSGAFTDESSQELKGTWDWKNTIASDGTVTTPDEPDVFSLTFDEDGNVGGTTDCNGFGGEYSLENSGEITFSSFVSTLMYCEGSQEAEFRDDVSGATAYSVSDNELTLELEGGGEANFTRNSEE